MSFPQSHLTLLVELALGADVTADPDTWSWTDATDYVRLGGAGQIQIVRGRADQASLADTSKLSMTVDNRDGRWSTRNPMGDWYGQLKKGTPIRVSAEGNVRFTGFVSALPPRWDVSGNDRWADVEAQGLLYRLSQGKTPARSTLRRWYMSSSPQPTAYWALDSGRFATAGLLTSGVGGPFESVDWGTRRKVESGTTDLAPWLGSGLLVSSDGVYAQATTGLAEGLSHLVAETSFSLSTVDGSICAAFFTITDDKAAPGPSATGNSVTLDIEQLADGSRNILVFGFFAGSFLMNETISIDDVDLFGPHHLRLDMEESGSDIDWAVYLDGVSVGTGTASSVSLPQYTYVTLAYTETAGDVVFGHVALYADATPPDVTDASTATQGYFGEEAHTRFDRLGTDEGVRTTTDGTSSQEMNYQFVKPLLELLRECEASDQGFLYEGLDFDLVLQTLQERYNQDPSLELDYTTSGHVAPPLEPTDDDRYAINDVTVERDGGSESQVVEEDTGVELSIPNIGRRDEKVTISLARDGQTQPIAAWRLHVGTTPGYRYPTVSLNLAAGPSLIDDWCATPLGGRITIDNPPDDLKADPVDLILEGYTETLNFFTWDVEANMSPAAPYFVFTIEDPVLGRLDTSGSSLALGVDSDDTSLLVATDSGKTRWMTTSERPQDFPFAASVGGELVTVTAISGTTSPQTFTVVRSVNSVVKSHSAGTDIRIAPVAVAP